MPNLYLSDLYRYVDRFNIKGHTMGRKTGDLLEMLVLGAIYKNEKLKERTLIEKSLEGFTSARHKVEFSVFQKDDEGRLMPNKPIGIIECKKVGVETTRSKVDFYLSPETSLEVSLANRWLPAPLQYRVLVNSVAEKSVKLTAFGGEAPANFKMDIGQRFKVMLDMSGKAYFVKPDEMLYDKAPDTMMVTCKIVELDAVRKGVAHFVQYNCLPGPQTIEKAKQIAFVSMDLRKKHSGAWDALPFDQEEIPFKSILVLGEATHWEEKSLNVVRKCMDHILVVPDIVLIDLLRKFLYFGGPQFFDFISKDAMQTNDDVRSLVMEHVEENWGQLFFDISQQAFVSISFDGKRLVCPTV